MTTFHAIEILFWVCIAAGVYSYVGLPFLALLRGLLFNKPFAESYDSYPSITICIAAYNEEAVIRDKLENTFSCDYPRDRIQVLVASDGSTDKTEQIVQGFDNKCVQLIALPRGGKNSALTQCVPKAQHDILVFTDADVLLEKNALKNITAPFADEDVGCVAGDFRYGGAKNTNDGEHVYWGFERWMKVLQTRGGSITSATGQLYALRRNYFTPIEKGVTDDFFTSVQAKRHGKRIIFQASARSYGIGVDVTEKEFIRKIRTITAGLKGVWAVRDLCNPCKHGFYAIQLFSHKVARRLTALPLVAQFVILLFIVDLSLWYLAFFLAQLTLHLFALVGFVLRHTRMGKAKIFVLPYYFDVVLLSAFIALYNIAVDHQQDLWSPQRSHT